MGCLIFTFMNLEKIPIGQRRYCHYSFQTKSYFVPPSACFKNAIDRSTISLLALF